jgi:CubicO group peptidase (beta-lactamase class C family)
MMTKGPLTRHSIALATCLAALSFAAIAATPDTGRRGAIEDGLRPKVDIAGEAPVHWNVYERMRRYRVPTMSVAIIENGHIAWSARYRSDGSVTLPAGDERFQAASLSKGITGSLAALLADRGVLNLDAPVDACLSPVHLPPGKQDAAHPVTLRNLLHHTSGATVNGFPGYPSGSAIPTPEQIVSGQPPANTPAVTIATVPGQAYAYSGGGYTLAQIAIARCAKAPFAELMQRYVLGPAGMRSSTFAQPLPPGPLHATGHAADGTDIPGGANTYPELAAAGLWTTADDLARWLIAIRNADQGLSSFLPKKAAVQMLTPGIRNYGLGVFISGEGAARRFMHEGGNAGFKSKYVMFLSSGTGAVILTDSDNGTPLNVEFTKAVAAAYGWPDFAPRVVARGALDTLAMEKHVGRYVVDDATYEGDRSLALIHDKGAWFLEMPNIGRTPLVPTGPMAFVAPETGYAVTVDDAGGLFVGSLRAKKA